MHALKGSPIDTLIWSCLLEERSGATSYNYDAAGAAYTLKWTFHNELGLVFVAVYQRILHLLYVDDLLAMVKRELLEMHDPKWTTYTDFDETFRPLKKEVEARAEDLKRLKKWELRCSGAFDVNKLQKLRAKGGKKAETLVSKGSKAEPKKKITKKNRVWDDSPPQEKLDFTDDVGENGDNIEVVAADHGESMMDKEEIFSIESKAEEEEGVVFNNVPEKEINTLQVASWNPCLNVRHSMRPRDNDDDDLENDNLDENPNDEDLELGGPFS
ncbi:signal recognition particle receptor subunit alpha-like [Juglans regia]|uniref:Signal recognition particle receptor subunit alpha-like n=1 Tax=Juglans regia TaxID=51240 RepID=A0A6P9EBI7_JUGRE|nr:signal recognition particle receptor subunit alpha-like [Juglans regia]